METIFNSYADKWEDETKYVSTITCMIANEWYTAIIMMGKGVVPFIFKRILDRGIGHWFHALAVLTGANPLKPEEAGDMYLNTHRWIQWGIDNGHIELPEPNTRFRHYDGDICVVADHARHTETEEMLILYRKEIDGPNSFFVLDDILWAIPAAMFLEVLETQAGVVGKRFTPI